MKVAPFLVLLVPLILKWCQTVSSFVIPLSARRLKIWRHPALERLPAWSSQSVKTTQLYCKFFIIDGKYNICEWNIKSCKTPDGRDVNLNDFTLSRTSVQRKQAEVREENLQNITKSFKAAAPSRLSLHWDGKKLKNSDGEKYEAQVIRVAGAPDYVEGKILGKLGQLLISHFNSSFT